MIDVELDVGCAEKVLNVDRRSSGLVVAQNVLVNLNLHGNERRCGGIFRFLGVKTHGSMR